MRLYILYLLLGAMLLAVQAHPLLPFARQGIRPDLVLILVLYLGTRPEIEPGAGALLVSLLGYFTAAFSGSPLGLYAFVYLLVFVATSMLQNVLELHSIYLQVLLVALSCILEAVLIFALCSVFYTSPHIFAASKSILPKQLAFTVAIAPVLLLMLNYLTRSAAENRELHLYRFFSKQSSVKPAAS